MYFISSFLLIRKGSRVLPLAMRYASLTEPKPMTQNTFTVFTGKRYLNSVENSVYVESLQAPVFEQLDNLIHLINHYPANKYEGNQLF